MSLHKPVLLIPCEPDEDGDDTPVHVSLSTAGDVVFGDAEGFTFMFGQHDWDTIVTFVNSQRSFQ